MDTVRGSSFVMSIAIVSVSPTATGLAPPPTVTVSVGVMAEPLTATKSRSTVAPAEATPVGAARASRVPKSTAEVRADTSLPSQGLEAGPARRDESLAMNVYRDECLPGWSDQFLRGGYTGI